MATHLHEADKERERIHRNMLSLVSHDLKTPLATIIGSLEIYTRMDTRLTAEKKEMLVNSALKEAYRLDSFITNILDLAKLENDMVRINTEMCDLSLVINDCITRLGPKAASVAFDLKGTSAPVMVRTDPMLLGRAIGILLDNAIKYAGTQTHITIEYGSQDDLAHVTIRDNGPGVPQDRLEDIFSKYTRFSTADHQNAGTGLGLTICRLMMRLLNGSVTALGKKDAEKGAEFTLRFSAALD